MMNSEIILDQMWIVNLNQNKIKRRTNHKKYFRGKFFKEQMSIGLFFIKIKSITRHINKCIPKPKL